MAKIIYCFKIYLFRDQLTSAEETSIHEFCLFASTIYVKAWQSCPIPSDAAVNDLEMLSSIGVYQSVNSKVAAAAFIKFKNHICYLSAELVPLCLFSNKVSNNEKLRIVERMRNLPADWTTP